MKKKRLTKETLDKAIRWIRAATKIKPITLDGKEYFIVYRDRKGLHGQEEKTQDT